MAQKPLLLLHGFGAESKTSKDESIKKSYEDLTERLKSMHQEFEIHEINLTRWLSLDDGVGLTDVSRAFQRALEDDQYEHLMQTGCDVFTHSTGALVVRDWIRRYSPKPCKINKIIHFAPALFGSGLAHVGRVQLARWGRYIFQGTPPGEAFLNTLEFGTHPTLDLHLHFLQEGNSMIDDYKVREYSIIGSQVPKKFRQVPVRYLKEDGSDCTVRVPAANPNFIYLKVDPNQAAQDLSFKTVKSRQKQSIRAHLRDDPYYDITVKSFPEGEGREVAPFGIPFQTAHIQKRGLFSGEDAWGEVFPFLESALNGTTTSAGYRRVGQEFSDLTDQTYDKAKQLRGELLEWNPKLQYEPHAMLVFRVRDQDGKPVEDVDINFETKGARRSDQEFSKLIEHTHGNKQYSGTFTFFLRVGRFVEEGDEIRVDDRLQHLKEVSLEITAQEPKSKDNIVYLPLRVDFSPEQIQEIIRPHGTTVVDINLSRVPSNDVFTVIGV